MSVVVSLMIKRWLSVQATGWQSMHWWVHSVPATGWVYSFNHGFEIVNLQRLGCSFLVGGMFQQWTCCLVIRICIIFFSPLVLVACPGNGLVTGGASPAIALRLPAE